MFEQGQGQGQGQGKLHCMACIEWEKYQKFCLL